MRQSSACRRLAGVLLSSWATLASGAERPVDEPLAIEDYVAIVLRSHPSAAQSAGLDGAARAEQAAARLFPDPVVEYSRAHGTTAQSGTGASESAYSVTQTVPWPGTFSAGRRAGDRAAEVLRADAQSLRWELAVQAREAFSRLAAARALCEIAQAAENDARALRDLVVRRAELGEARESDRIKAEVEWLRQQRRLKGVESDAQAAEAAARLLAVARLPTPLVLSVDAHGPLPPLDHAALVAQVEHNPRLRAAGARAERQRVLLSLARRSRIPDLSVTLFRERDLDKRATGVGVAVKLPLWNRAVGEVARAQAATHVAHAEAERLRLELLVELETRLAELQSAGGQSQLLEREVLPAATRSVALVRRAFEEGETSLLELLDAQRTLRDTQRDVVEADLALARAVNEVQRLVGPSFDPWRY